MKLSELQALFQSAILAGDAEDADLLDRLAASCNADGTTMFGVYVNAYRIRLTEYLDEDYPALCALIGDDEFDALVEDYIGENPSRQRNARWYSASLPEFMQKRAAEALAIGLAMFERALTDAFDAADAEALTIETLAEFAPESWPFLTFSFHPSLQLLAVAAGTLDVYAAVTSEEEQQIPAPREGEETIAVWRSVLDLSYRELDPDEFLALNEARAGRSFGEICQLVAFQNENQSAPERLAQFLVSWFSEGLVIATAEQKAE